MPELTEYIYTFYANIAKVMGPDFAPYMPELVAHLCTVVSSNDGEKMLSARDLEERTGQAATMGVSDLPQRMASSQALPFCYFRGPYCNARD